VADGRLGIPALAARVGVSRATAYARFQRLVDSHVIDGFTARVAPDALGLGVVALLMLAVRQGAWPDLSRRLGELPGVDWVGLCTGPFDFVLRVRVADLHALRELVLDRVLAMPEIRSSQTILVLDEVHAARPAAPGPADTKEAPR
jgi:DNA-binding Lrp family transcriptional regulator